MENVIASAFLTAAVALATPPPSLAPPSAESGLREIGHVRAVTGFCRRVAEHTREAADALFANDDRTADDVRFLRTADFDSGVIAKFRSTRDLTERFVTLRESAKAGRGEAQAIRIAAADAPSPEQKVALTGFANALAGGLNRQVELADSIGRLIAYLDAHPPLSREAREDSLADAMRSQNTLGGYRGDPRDLVPRTLDETARVAGDDLLASTTAIDEDRRHAASFVPTAFAGCW